MGQVLGQIGRLTGFFRSGLGYSNYEQILKTARRKASGNLPADVLSCVISKGENKKSAIQGFEKMLNETVDILGEINTVEKQFIENIPNNLTRLQEVLISYLFSPFESIPKEKVRECIIRAEKKLLEGMKKYVPDVQSIIITPIGSGAFGNGYKLQVLEKDGKKIFDDKVLKVYKETSINELIMQRNKRYIDSLSDENLVEYYKKFDPKISSVAEIRKKLQEQFAQVNDTLKNFQRFHGAMAEANIAEFLRFFTGHKLKPEDGLALPSYFGLGKTKFAFGEFISAEQKAKKIFDFNRLFLTHTDFEYNLGNAVNGICIDIGGISPQSKQVNDIFSNKGYTRILKSILRLPPDKRKIALEKHQKSGALPEHALRLIEEILNIS